MDKQQLREESQGQQCETCGFMIEGDMMDHISNFHSVRSYYICSRCGGEIPGGLANVADHETTCPVKPEPMRPLTVKDMEKLIEEMNQLPAPKQQMIVGKGFMEMIPDSDFVSYMTYLGENYEVMMGRDSYEYFNERWERLGGL